MSAYRILRIARVEYQAAFQRLYAEHPGLADAPFEEQQRRFFALGLVYSDSFSKAMRGLGNEAHEIVCNAEIMQKSWARDHRLPPEALGEDVDWINAIGNAQIAALKPDVVYVQGMTTDPAMLRIDAEFRERHPYVRLAVGYAGFPVGAEALAAVDMLIAGMPCFREIYADARFPTHHVYHGFDDNVLTLLDRRGGPDGGGAHDFTFVGSSGFGFGDSHASRYWALIDLAVRTNLRLWLYERANGMLGGAYDSRWAQIRDVLDQCKARFPAARVAETFRQLFDGVSDGPPLPLAALLPERAAPAQYGLDMFATLARSKLTFNLHTDAMNRESGNIRLFEATGVGAGLVTDASANLADLFEPDHEVVTYSSIDEAVDKIGYLLEHEDARRKIAEAGQRRTLKDHTVARRVDRIDALIAAAL